jgi:hypothetical protein
MPDEQTPDESLNAGPMPHVPARLPLGGGRSAPLAADFDAQYRAHTKDVFRDVVARDLEDGSDPTSQARAYAERGKPDFVLAYLLVSDLPDTEKRALYALAYERRADLTNQIADDFDRRFHRPFPLMRLEATKDRTTAQRIRSGGSLRPGLGRPLPTL